MSKVAGSALLKELTAARCAATVVAGSARTDHPNLVSGDCLRRALGVPKLPATHGQSRLERVATLRSVKRYATVDRSAHVDSQADSGGSIPGSRSTSKSVAAEPPFRSCLGHVGSHLSTPGTHPSASEDAQLVPSCSPTVRFSGSSTVTQGVSPQVRARHLRAQRQRRQETRPVIPRTRQRVGRRGARPVDHP